MTDRAQRSLDFRVTDIQAARTMDEGKPLTLVYVEVVNQSGQSLQIDLHLPTVITPTDSARAATRVADSFIAGEIAPDERIETAFGFDPSNLLTLQYGDRIVFRWNEDSSPTPIEFDFTVNEENSCELQPIEEIRKRMKAMEYLKEGFEAMENEDHEMSIKYFTKALEHDPSSSVALGHRGLSRSYLENHAEAVEDLTAALELNESEAGWYLFRGISLFHLNRKEEARRDLEKYLKEGDPDDEEREEAEEYLLKCR